MYAQNSKPLSTSVFFFVLNDFPIGLKENLREEDNQGANGPSPMCPLFGGFTVSIGLYTHEQTVHTGTSLIHYICTLMHYICPPPPPLCFGREGAKDCAKLCEKPQEKTKEEERNEKC